MSALLVRTDGTVDLLADQDLGEAAKTLHDETGGGRFAEMELLAGDRPIAYVVIEPNDSNEVNPKAGRVVLLLMGVHVILKGPVVFRELASDVAADLLDSLKED
jgi:hypothetical protein